MYLRTVYELEEEGITPLRARIAERLDQSGPTVSQTVARMERDGLMVVEHDRSLSLTPLGRAKATAVMRKHRLAERLLTDVLGLDLTQVHEEACRWEHVMSTDVEKRLVDILDNPSRSPFGTPIPGLVELGITGAEATNIGVRLSDLDLATPVTATVEQISEILQLNKEQFNAMHDAGIRVGSVVTVSQAPSKGSVTVSNGEGANIVLRPELTHAFRVNVDGTLER